MRRRDRPGQGKNPPSRRVRQVMLRDGLMIALLAGRAMRTRSLQTLRLGSRLRHDGVEWRIALEAGDIKNGRPLDYHLDRRLTPRMNRYLAVERVELLGGKPEDAT